MRIGTRANQDGRIRWFLAAFVLVAAAHDDALAQAPEACKVGQAVADAGKNPAVIVGGNRERCLVRYDDGQTQRWIAQKDLSVTAPDSKLAPLTGLASTPALNRPVAEGVTVLRPVIINRLVYRADALGHVVVPARIDGTAIKFLVDTGATLVSLSPEDASAVGLKPDALKFDKLVHTANGPAKAAFAELRRIRIEQLEIENIPVAVIENLKQSVLGMSFLHRLKSFEMRDGELSLVW
jgi:aspartyl protease family protein